MESKGDSVRVSHGDDDEGYVEEWEGKERDGKPESGRKGVCDEGKDEKEDGEVFEGRSPSFYFDTSDDMDIDYVV